MVELDFGELLLRLGLALILGLVLGYEREQHGRAAGMRTTMLVCVASAVVMLLSEHLFLLSGDGAGAWRPDPARLAAGVLAGMGFLGAGVIIQQQSAVYGLTTAAVLWFSAILGMAFGAGYYSLGLLGFGVVLLALFILPGIESRIRSDRYASLLVEAGPRGPDVEALRKLFRTLAPQDDLKLDGLEHAARSRRRVVTFTVKTKNHRLQAVQEKVVPAFAALKGVAKVKWV